MPYPVAVTRQDMCFDIPVDEFRNLLHFESADWHYFSLPTLSTVLDHIDGVSDTEYNGHFGSHIFARFELDENGEVPQLAEFQERLDEFFADVRRAADIMPQLMAGKGDEYAQVSGKGDIVRRTMLYSDDQFLISDSIQEHAVTVFYKEDGVPMMKEIPRVSGILALINADRNERSFDTRSRREITLSRDIPRVRERIAKLLNLADPAELPLSRPKDKPVDVSRHFLKDDLPRSAVPVYSQPLYIIADSGQDMGVSITFKCDGEIGTKWFTDQARQQVLDIVRRTEPAIDRWVRRQLPDDIEGPTTSFALPR